MIKAQEKRHKQSIKNNNQQLGRRSSYKGNNQNSKTNIYLMRKKSQII